MPSIMETNCPECGERISSRMIRCPSCHIYILEGGALPDVSEPRHDAWTQGMTTDFRSNGEYEATEYEDMPLSIALRTLRQMPVLPEDKMDEDYCPPHLGFGTDLTISRFSEGKYTLYPDDKDVSLEKAEERIRVFFRERE